MKEIVFVGMGLNDEKGVSIKGLEEIKTAKNVFIELYTNLMPNFSIDNLKKITGKNPYILSRYELEEGDGEIILDRLLRAILTGELFRSFNALSIKLLLSNLSTCFFVAVKRTLYKK